MHAAARNGAKPAIRVVVAASAPDVRGALARELDDAGFEVSAAEETAEGLIAAAFTHAPDACAVTTDLGQSGVLAAARITDAAPRTKVVIVAGSNDEYGCLLYLLAGASAYIERDAEDGAVASAVRGVVAGLAIIPPAAQRRLLDALRA